MNRLSQIVPLQHDSIVSPYPAAGWRAAFADLGRKGFTGVEIAVTYPERIDVPALCRAAEENHLAVTTISTGQSYWEEGISLTAPDPAVRARAAAIVRGHVDLSARIGRPPVTIGLLRGQPEDGAAALELLAQELLPLAAYAAGRGVVLQVEPIRRVETTLLNSTAETLAFLRRLGDRRTWACCSIRSIPAWRMGTSPLRRAWPPDASRICTSWIPIVPCPAAARSICRPCWPPHWRRAMRARSHWRR